MHTMAGPAGRWFLLAEHALVRAFLFAMGIALVASSAVFALSVVLLPLGLLLACAGVAVTIWATLSDLFEQESHAQANAAAPASIVRTPSDCRWGRFEEAWMCAHPNGESRPVMAQECAGCTFWEAAPLHTT